MSKTAREQMEEAVCLSMVQSVITGPRLQPAPETMAFNGRIVVPANSEHRSISAPIWSVLKLPVFMQRSSAEA
jgi:hypothetical protein